MRVVATTATRILAICGKCGKKLGGGFGEGGRRPLGEGGSQPLGKALRRRLKGAKGKHATLRIIETKCLDICPKGAVAMLDSAQPGAVVLVAQGTPIAVVAARLGLLVA